MTPMMPITPTQGGVPVHPPHGPTTGMMPRQGMVPFANLPMGNPQPMGMPGAPAGPQHMGNTMLGHPQVTPQMQQVSI